MDPGPPSPQRSTESPRGPLSAADLAEIAAIQSKLAEERRLQEPPPPPPLRQLEGPHLTCLRCGNDFRPRFRGFVFCSYGCRILADDAMLARAKVVARAYWILKDNGYY